VFLAEDNRHDATIYLVLPAQQLQETAAGRHFLHLVGRLFEAAETFL